MSGSLASARLAKTHCSPWLMLTTLTQPAGGVTVTWNPLTRRATTMTSPGCALAGLPTVWLVVRLVSRKPAMSAPGSGKTLESGPVVKPAVEAVADCPPASCRKCRW